MLHLRVAGVWYGDGTIFTYILIVLYNKTVIGPKHVKPFESFGNDEVPLCLPVYTVARLSERLGAAQFNLLKYSMALSHQ